MSDSVWPRRQQPTRFPCPWDSPGKNTGVGCHFLLQCMKGKSENEVAQSSLTPSDPMDCSPPGSSICGIFIRLNRDYLFLHLAHFLSTGLGLSCSFCVKFLSFSLLLPVFLPVKILWWLKAHLKGQCNAWQGPCVPFSGCHRLLHIVGAQSSPHQIYQIVLLANGWAYQCDLVCRLLAEFKYRVKRAPT